MRKTKNYEMRNVIKEKIQNFRRVVKFIKNDFKTIFE